MLTCQRKKIQNSFCNSLSIKISALQKTTKRVLNVPCKSQFPPLKNKEQKQHKMTDNFPNKTNCQETQTNPNKRNSGKVGQQVTQMNLGMAEASLQTTSLSKKHQEIFPKSSLCPLFFKIFFHFPFLESFTSTRMKFQVPES